MLQWTKQFILECGGKEVIEPSFEKTRKTYTDNSVTDRYDTLLGGHRSGLNLCDIDAELKG